MMRVSTHASQSARRTCGITQMETLTCLGVAAGAVPIKATDPSANAIGETRITVVYSTCKG